jgi:hypothetical protein
MPRSAGNQNREAVLRHVDLKEQFRQSLIAEQKWDSIIDFATHPSFCGKKLYPRQATLLKLIYLETENFTAFDLDVIEEWRTNFSFSKLPIGVQADVWERIDYLKSHGYHHFPHVQAVMGRRASKGMIGGILGAERLAYMLSLDDPQKHFGLDVSALYMNVVATNIIQAKAFQFADIRQTVETCPFFEPYISTSKEYGLTLRTNADKRRIAEYEHRGLPIDHEIASLRCLAMSSTASSGRGATSFCVFFDEFAHMITTTEGPRSSNEVYSSYTPSLDQFGKDSLIYIPSSPFTKIGAFFELYQQGSVLLEDYLTKTGTLVTERNKSKLAEEIEGEAETTMAEPEMLVVQLPSWALYEDYQRSPQLGGPRFKRPIQVYDDRMKRLENRNPEKFKVERKAQFAEVEDAWLNPDKVDEMFEPFWGGRKLKPNLVSEIRYRYEGHADPGLSNANFALCIAHLEDAPGPDTHGFVWPHVVVDYLQVWQAREYEDHTIDYVQVEQDLEYFISCFPSMNIFSMDQWNSAGLRAQLIKRFGNRPRITIEDFNEKANQQRSDYFKSALNLGWVHCYKDSFHGDGQSLLEQELKFLSVDKRNRVVKQDVGPVQTKDMFDCLAMVVERLLKESLDRWQRELLGISPALGNQHGNPDINSTSYVQASQSRRNLEDLKNRGAHRRMGVTVAPGSGGLRTRRYR